MTYQPETLAAVMARVRGQRSSLVVTILNGHLALRPVDDLPEEEQRQLWREPGWFWICGAPIQVHEAWSVTVHPDDAQAQAIAALLMVEVAAHVQRPHRPPRRHPTPPPMPGVTWH
jgi:hypothetical protein